MEEYIKVAVLENEFEAQLVDSILVQRNIPHLMRSYHDTAYDGLFQTQKGWGHVSAPGSFAEEIRALITEVREAARHGVSPDPDSESNP